ncbi:MAG TPA: DUF1553 domain-containing protein [Acidobacteriota bacterium]|jgi:hypothetical protein
MQLSARLRLALIFGIATLVSCASSFLIFAGQGSPPQGKNPPPAQPSTTSAVPVEFNRDIRLIFSDNCYPCHGPDEAKRKARLRFDIKEVAFGKPGVIIPGKSADSKLVQRVSSENPDRLMPPPDSGRSLTARQVELLRRWIDEGARWEIHWAYVPPKRPDVPGLAGKREPANAKGGDNEKGRFADPHVVAAHDTNKSIISSWPKNSIDYFILSRLDAEGMTPSPEADKATLLRRVTIDLTGLPPTPLEIRSFLADTAPGAYEKRVDQLLQSPHYGERMAMQWLDLARYADTHGYHIDPHRDMWAWRDWVVSAFNRNMPFDQFTVEQLAGDLLPDATIEQKIASGFNRNHMINFEGGAIPEEYLVEYVADRVETTATTWMGMTIGCARCHSHKHDPITQHEFYQFFAFFNTVAEKGLDGRNGNADPILKLPNSTQKARMEELEATIKEKAEALSDACVKPEQEAWETTLAGKTALASREGLIAQYEMNGSLSDVSGHYLHGRTVRGDPTFGAGPVGRAVTFDGDSIVAFDSVGSFEHTSPFSIAVWMRGSTSLPISVFQKIEDPVTRRGYEMWLDDLILTGPQKRAARVVFRLTSQWPENRIELRTAEHFALAEWHQITFTYDGSCKAAGLKVYVNGKPAEVEVIQDRLTGPVGNAAELQIGNKNIGEPFKGNLDDLRIYDRVLSAVEVDQLAIHFPVQVILSGVNGKATEEESVRLRDYFLTYAASKPMRTAYSELVGLKKTRDELEKTIPSVMVMSEMKKPRDTFFLTRGDYRNKTEKVSPGVPSVLPPLPAEAPPNRLTLARWLVDPAHPLTARVAVNHFWQMYFGQGIVKTSEDFGLQGDAPSHPELLDWLATEFIRSGWDIRAMQRLIVTSATYRQSSRLTPALREKDPENRLLARGPRFRLPAEMIRDGALAAGGLLNPEMGGPGVFPYQPQGLWEETAFGAGYSAQSYTPARGKDLYRRSLYTFLKRTVPPPSMATFDAPDREKCTARRAVTNTPLQALVLMNDPTYVEAARALAQRTLREAGKTERARVDYAFFLATARPPSTAERRILEKLLRQERKRYGRDRASALELLRVGDSAADHKLDPSELASWTVVAGAILNLDETITKE